MFFSASSIFLAAASLVSTVAAASLQQVTNFGNSPSGAQMYIYIPDNVKTNPPILVGIHWCTGSAQAFYSGTGYKTLADTYGFIVIYPSAITTDGCWDVASTASLTHNGGGDSLAIKNMVLYAISTYGADASRVYATGHSSGGMMTNVMLGAYPDIFKAGAAFAGVPFGCFASDTSSWSTACATGQITKTPEEWGALVRAAYPGYTGTRPKMQLWHGTEDDTLYFHNFEEEIKQWTNVLGVSQTPTSTENNFLGYSGWVRTKYGTQVEAIKEQGQPHNLIIVADQVVSYFGLNVASTTTTATPTTPTIIASSTTTPTATATSTTGVAKWGQCGGIGYTGSTTCISSTCTAVNAYYSQCL
ncbi:uncharacterized protein LAJ45_08278 [Morchella importuna]|uniref:uncharacterized protein n=1 Tax=Morchella importuna TaxID=1174673 RepID=UPI001E8DA4C9|nr:uncharacterized protein LAJ45_08278 [Morchella importuna]KAH8147812.1 hypothetical protein LAJ45_08278 [Morchella importuna]